MILIIDTSDNEIIKLSLAKEDGVVFKTKKIKAHRSQAEKLLPAIEKIVLEAKTSLQKLSKIKVVHEGSSFTSLRIGVLTANALSYALNIPVETFNSDNKSVKKIDDFNIVVPKYNRDPDIKIKKNVYF